MAEYKEFSGIVKEDPRIVVPRTLVGIGQVFEGEVVIIFREVEGVGAIEVSVVDGEMVVEYLPVNSADDVIIALFDRSANQADVEYNTVEAIFWERVDVSEGVVVTRMTGSEATVGQTYYVYVLTPSKEMIEGRGTFNRYFTPQFSKEFE